MKKLKGILPAIITPLNRDGTVIEQSLRKHIDFLLESGVHGLYVGGSTGEGLILPAETREHAAEIIVNHTKGSGKHIMVHVGAVDTKTAVRLARHAEAKGADSIASVPPFYYRVDNQCVYNFYKEVAEAVNLPVYIYNIPVLTNIVVDAPLSKWLMEIRNVTGIKYSSGDLAELQQIKDLNNGEFQAFFGVDEILLAGLVSGADGGIGGTYNAMSNKYVEVYEAAQRNDWVSAAVVQREIARYFHMLSKYKNHIAVQKAILEVIHGMDFGSMTHPLRDLTADEKVSLAKDLKDSKFYEWIGFRG